jgi:hypothetical protein
VNPFTSDEFVPRQQQNDQHLGRSLDCTEEVAEDLTRKGWSGIGRANLGKLFKHSNNALFSIQVKVKFFYHTSFPKYLPILFSRFSDWENRLSSLRILTPLNPKISSRYLSMRDSSLVSGVFIGIGGRKRSTSRKCSNLDVVQRWPSERLGAVKMGKPHLIIFPTIVREPRSFTGSSSITRGPFKFIRVSPSIEHSATLIASHQLQSDLITLVERYRTGLFWFDPWVYKLLRGCLRRRLMQMVRRQLVPPHPQRREGPYITSPYHALGRTRCRYNHPLPERRQRAHCGSTKLPLPAVCHDSAGAHSVLPSFVCGCCM